ncbi:hypothetical protein [Pyxidicoccus xibeiensis]|uniref:hypothetical protein n=1 Tax=Pyxidicoccus xibeiensis TaxID=2906759 RepID=UPI0020A7ADC9|nr:hypothetical protein [Pyxidicoccus xibeiensis]MCP3142105.1 hypothetical protein [Pyxidicoccus xibeiensis]
MLKPIHRVNCLPALAACQRLMQRFVLWLCDANVHGTDVTEANLRAQMPSTIEGEWLCVLVAVDQRSTTKTKKLLEDAKAIADLPAQEKQGLKQWVQAVANLSQHFTAAPPAALPIDAPNGWKKQGRQWTSFKALMVAFYEEGLRDGLPYQSNGTPTADTTLRVTYKQFEREFRQAHRLDPHPDAREVCVLCGGELKLPAVDHWVGKAAFPLLAVCADNLLPICGECNEAPQKGQRPVHADGNFTDWFHPYHRHSSGALRLRYDEVAFAIRVDSNDPAHMLKVSNLDTLLNLGERWTREFKAEYRRVQREVEKLRKKQPGLTLDEVRLRLTDYRDRLSDAEPNVDVHRIVAETVLTPARLSAL